MTMEYENPSTPTPDSNKSHRTQDMVSMVADDSTNEETNTMKESRENETTEAMDNANQPNSGITPVNDSNQHEKDLTMTKSQYHDTQQEALADEWLEPTPFENSWSSYFPGFDPRLLPTSFVPVVASFSRAFNVSMETIAVILTFMVSAAVGKSVRVQNATGEWGDVGHRVALVSGSWEKMSNVLLAMATVFLDVRMQQTSAEVVGGSDGGKVRTGYKGLFNELRRRGNAKSGTAASPVSFGKSIAYSDFACPSHLDGICWGLVSGEPECDIVCGNAAYVINLNGTPMPDVEWQSDGAAGSPIDHICVINPEVIADNIANGSLAYLFEHPCDIVEWADSDKAIGPEFPVGDREMTLLREVLTRAFQIGSRGIDDPIDLIFSAEAQALRDDYGNFAAAMCRQDGPPDDADEFATKFAAIHELFDEDCSGEEVSIQSWIYGSTFASYLYCNTDKIADAILTSPITSKAERLLQNADGLITPFTIDDIVRTQCGGITGEEEAVVALKVLIELRWVRLTAKTAGAQEDWFEFHPDAFEQASKNSDSDPTTPNDQLRPE